MKRKIPTRQVFLWALPLVALFTFSKASAIPLPIDPTIRFAKSRVVVLKKEMTIDNAGKVSVQTSTLCDADLKVPVWADVTGDYNYVPAQLDCQAVMNGNPITLTSTAALKFSTAQIFPNSPSEKFKEAQVNNSFSAGAGLPLPPDLVVVTRDLHQKSFVLPSAPKQSVSCTNVTNCRVINPVIWTITWDIEDSE